MKCTNILDLLKWWLIIWSIVSVGSSAYKVVQGRCDEVWGADQYFNVQLFCPDDDNHNSR